MSTSGQLPGCGPGSNGLMKKKEKSSEHRINQDGSLARSLLNSEESSSAANTPLIFSHLLPQRTDCGRHLPLIRPEPFQVTISSLLVCAAWRAGSLDASVLAEDLTNLLFSCLKYDELLLN